MQRRAEFWELRAKPDGEEWRIRGHSTLTSPAAGSSGGLQFPVLTSARWLVAAAMIAPQKLAATEWQNAITKLAGP